VTPDRRTLLALFSLAFGLRILFAAVFGSNPDVITNHDTYGFRIATRMIQDWSWLTTPFTPNAPGYVMVLASAFKLFGVSWWTAVVVNSLLSGLTTFFLYRIGEKRFGPRAGLHAGLWLALAAHQIVFACYPVRDTLVTFLFTWFIYNLVAPFRRMRVAIWLAFVYTLLVMTEPLFLVLLPALVVYFALFATQHRLLSFQYVFLFLAFLLFFNIPWTIRNFAVHGEIVPIAIEAQQYTDPLVRSVQKPTPAGPDEVDLPPRARYPQPGYFDNMLEFWRVVRIADAPADPERARRAEPAWSLRHNLTSVITYGLLLPFLLVGIIRAIRRRHRTGLILAGAILSYAFVRGFMTGDDRPRLVIEPLIILLAMYGMRELVRIRDDAGKDPANA
jgi:4-amino-4-deoxy-L-arabinose transferase-like glycosyltransferase